MNKEQLRAAALLLHKKGDIADVVPTMPAITVAGILFALADVARELADLEEPTTVENPVARFRNMARGIIAPLPVTMVKLNETLDKLTQAVGQCFVPHSELNKSHKHVWKTAPGTGGLIDVCECGEERA